MARKKYLYVFSTDPPVPFFGCCIPSVLESAHIKEDETFKHLFSALKISTLFSIAMVFIKDLFQIKKKLRC